MITVLLSSVGRRVELVRAFQRALIDLRIPGRVVGTDVDWLAPGLHVVDRGYLVPRCHEPDFIPAILAICESECVNVLLPLIDPEIPVYAAAAPEFQARGVQLGVVDSCAAEIAADKWRTVEYFGRLGLPVPKSWLPGHPDIASLHFPCFLKPRRGSAGADTHPIQDADELEYWLGRVPDPMIQELLPGPEITSDVVCDFGGSVLGIASRQRISVRGGEAMKSVTVCRDDIRDLCHTIAQTLPARGPFTVQCMLSGNQPLLIEINARLGGGAPLAIAAGMNIPQILLRLAAGETVDPLPATAVRAGLHMTRCDESLFLEESARDGLGRYPL